MLIRYFSVTKVGVGKFVPPILVGITKLTVLIFSYLHLGDLLSSVSSTDARRGGIEPGLQDREPDAVTTKLNRSGTQKEPSPSSESYQQTWWLRHL